MTAFGTAAGGRGAALLAALVAAGCTPQGASRPATSLESRLEPRVVARPTPAPRGSLPVAVIFPTAGRHALSGRQSLHGARLAAEDLNGRGGIRGRPVALLAYETGSYFLDAREAATLAARDGALALVGANSSDLSMAIAEVAEARGLVQVSNVSTAQDLTVDPATGGPRAFVFRVCATDAAMGALLAAFARDRLAARRTAVLYEVGRTYSARLARSFVESFQDASGGRRVAEFFYLSQEIDFRPQLRDVLAFAPDALFVPGSFTDATLIASQGAAIGLSATLLGADGWSNPLLFKKGAPTRAAYFVDHCAPPAGFNDRYHQAFGQETHGCRAALAYDALGAVAEGLRSMGPLADADLGERLGTTRRRLRDAVAREDFKGLTGRVRFDPTGNRRTGMAVLEVLPRPGGVPGARLFGWVGER
ncbi:MAG TPA: ABC transporter substrate-binding protein [Vicinamibacteria bacterium]|nr:ABC transporter substrate-binding protein [Vicinamibacteria bacterium]